MSAPIGRPTAAPIPAAVLVPLYRIAGPHPAVVLTRRRSDLRNHAGEISFPGGRREAHDRDLLETALREAGEEIGLAPADVRVLGELPQALTFSSNYLITPFIAVVRPGRVWRPSRAEVEAVLELPLEELRSTFARRHLKRGEGTFASETYGVEDQLVWGATARILGNLFAWLENTPRASWPHEPPGWGSEPPGSGSAAPGTEPERS